jgi:putative ABC transport system substrate-binding protein
LRLVIVRATTANEIEAAFALLAERQAGALLVSAAPFLDTRREQLLELTARHSIPAIYAWPAWAASGGLISYGASLAGVYRQLGIYAGRILKGAKPADLPVQQPAKFELVINLKTARALGLKISESFLLVANEVIE